MPRFGADGAQLEPVLPSRIKTFAIALKSYAKAVIKVFTPVQFYLICLLFSKYFVRDCRYPLILSLMSTL